MLQVPWGWIHRWHPGNLGEFWNDALESKEKNRGKSGSLMSKRRKRCFFECLVESCNENSLVSMASISGQHEEFHYPAGGSARINGAVPACRSYFDQYCRVGLLTRGSLFSSGSPSGPNLISKHEARQQMGFAVLSCCDETHQPKKYSSQYLYVYINTLLGTNIIPRHF